MFEVHCLQMLKDNYAWLLSDGGEFWLVDAPMAGPVTEFIRGRGKLKGILVTHHHYDHVGSNLELQKEWQCEIYGNGADAERVPGITRHLKDGEIFEILGRRVTCMDVPGHTIGHVAYYFEAPPSGQGRNKLFCGDTLFGGGCGRLFEGTPEQMFASLTRLAALPDDAMVFCAHEYTFDNLRFAMTVEPGNVALKERIGRLHGVYPDGKGSAHRTIPSAIALEKATNPFLRCNSPEIRRNINMIAANDAEIFAELRRRKDGFV